MIKKKQSELRKLIIKEITLYKEFPKAYTSPSCTLDEYIETLQEIYDADFLDEKELDNEILASKESLEAAKIFIKKIYDK